MIACQLVVHCRRQADMGILQKPDFDDIVRKKSMQARDSSSWSLYVAKPTGCLAPTWLALVMLLSTARGKSFAFLWQVLAQGLMQLLSCCNGRGTVLLRAAVVPTGPAALQGPWYSEDVLTVLLLSADC